MRHIVVVGLMGSGKTTIGRRLAESLGWAHRDSDADLRATTGRTAREIADVEGIDRLHALELGHLLDALADPKPSVISAAASVIDGPRGRTALADPAAPVVWLRIDAATAARRAPKRGADHRPAPESLEVQAARRDPLFADVADVTVDVAAPGPDGRPDAIAERILAELRPGEVTRG